jgi:hypothetical protein|nr:MAG TPA: SOS-response transcriptional repressor [Caudoviricetes sp.]
MIIERIKIMADTEGISLAELERKIGASQSTLSKAYKGKKDIQSKWLTAIVMLYPQYSADWILTGETPIYKQDKSKDLRIDGGGHIIANSNGSSIMLEASQGSNSQSFELLESLLKTREEQVKELTAMIKTLQESNQALISKLLSI